jgi:hypothetical protein
LINLQNESPSPKSFTARRQHPIPDLEFHSSGRNRHHRIVTLLPIKQKGKIQENATRENHLHPQDDEQEQNEPRKRKHIICHVPVLGYWAHKLSLKEGRRHWPVQILYFLVIL